MPYLRIEQDELYGAVKVVITVNNYTRPLRYFEYTVQKLVTSVVTNISVTRMCLLMFLAARFYCVFILFFIN